MRNLNLSQEQQKSFDKNILIKEGGKRVKGYYRYSFRNKPLITIITVILNKDKDLEKLLKVFYFKNMKILNI